MKIGLIPFYLELYDNLSAKNREGVVPLVKKIAEELQKRDLEVIEAPVCRLKNEFSDAIKSFEAAGCCAIATLHLAYSPSLEAIDAFAATNLPIVIIDTTIDYEFECPSGIMANHGIHGVQDFCNLLLRRGKTFLLAAGHWQYSDCLEQTAKNLKSAAMAYRMTHGRVGKVGGDFEGMGDFRFPEGSFGMQIIDYEYEDAFKVSDSEIEAEKALDKERFYIPEKISDETMNNTMSASLIIRKWAEMKKLDAFTIAFPGINRSSNWATVPFLECSKAMARGIGYAGEGDALTALLCRCLLDIYPESSFTEMFCPDWKNERIFTSHMGEINPAVCAAPLNLHEQNYRFSDTGNPAIGCGCLKSGNAILVNLAPGADGKFTLIAAKVVFDEVKGPSTATNAGYFRPVNGTIAEFLKAYSEVGGTHHLVCSYNADVEIIRNWAKLMKWDFVLID